ncbi:MAG: B12-binding domain-containing radical SAM protein [Deltaproteobacteria bacterium]|nr:B12-binding domain-containing radical SAM protein [Deltaproteobacteria bacterium]
MRLYLINPFNPYVCTTNTQKRYWSRYRVWKPLGLIVLANLTPQEWDITLIDENLHLTSYNDMPRPNLVGITAFSSQAVRAYELAAEFRKDNVPVVIGGIHATMRLEEALEHADAVVTGEAENVWRQVLKDASEGKLKRVYKGERLELNTPPHIRRNLVPPDYPFGSIQTARGCPLNCSFCSVTVFNGRRIRHRPIENVLMEIRSLREKYFLFVDDNLIGTRHDHIVRTKKLLRTMIKEKLSKNWGAQVTINMADDEELLDLSAKAGCVAVFIGFESPSEEGLIEVNKKFNIQKNRDFKASVKRIHDHNILVIGSFIIGLDVDRKGIGRLIADTASYYGLDALNVLFLTPLPGTTLWKKMKTQDRILANSFPNDWQYYTFGFPVAKHTHLPWPDMIREYETCRQTFYSHKRVFNRVFTNLINMRRPLLTLVGNLALKGSYQRIEDCRMYLDLKKPQDEIIKV